MLTLRRPAVPVLALAGALVAAGAVPAVAAPAAPRARAALVSDGGLLVIGLPGEDEVDVVRGFDDGIQRLDQDSVVDGVAIADTKEAGDRFGDALALGDLDGDGILDLAVGASNENDAQNGQGAAHVIRGDGVDFTGKGNAFAVHPDAPFTKTAEFGEATGAAVAFGDLDGDGADELLLASPRRDEGNSDRGLVESGGGDATGFSTGPAPITELGDTDGARFGFAVIAPDLDGDGRADMVAGSPGGTASNAATGGEVAVILSSTSTPTFLEQSGTGDEAPEAADSFGESLAAGDFDGDGDPDLAVGAPFESFSGASMAGAVSVFRNDGHGALSRWQFLHQGLSQFAETPELADQFGGELAVGDFDGDGYDDLAIGVHDEKRPGSSGDIAGAGLVHVLFGSPDGLSLAGNVELTAQKADLRATAAFGRSLAAGDLDGDGLDDLAVGVPFDEVDGQAQAGRVELFRGGASGLTRVGSISEETPGIGDGVTAGAEFGRALAIAPARRLGYTMADEVGNVYPFGDARAYDAVDPAAGAHLVAMATEERGRGLWLLDSAGHVHVRGAAHHFGDVDLGSLRAGESPAALSVLADGSGYWVFTDRGRALAFGAAVHHGDLFTTLNPGGVPIADILNGPVIASVATPSGGGYYMIATDGGVFAFGDAAFHGSMGGQPLNLPVVGVAPDPDGEGYWLVAADGGMFAFKAPFKGSIPGVLPAGVQLNKPVIGAIAFSDAYLLVASDGGIFNFSREDFFGSLGANPPPDPVIGVAAFAR